MPLVRRLLELPLGYYLGFALGRISSLVVLPMVAHFSGPTGFGHFEVALAVLVATAILFDAGVGTAVVRFWRDQRVVQDSIVGSAMVTQLSASALAVCAFTPVMVVFAPPGESLALLLLAMALFAVVEGLAVVASGFLRAREQDRTYFLLSITRLILTTGLGAYGARSGGPAGALFGVAVGGAGFALYALSVWPRRGLTGTAATRRALRRYGMPLIVTTFAAWMLALSDRLFLRFTVPAGQLGDYAANYRLGGLVLLFVAAPLGLVWIPEAQRTSTAMRPVKSRKWMLGFSAIALLASASVVLIGPAFVPFFFGHDFVADRFVIGFIALSGWLGGLYYLIGTPLLVSDSTRLLAVGGLFTILVNIVLDATLIPAFGTRGAAVATFLSYAAFCVSAALAARRESKRMVTA